MDFPCADNSCIVFTVLLLIMAASCVHALFMLHSLQPVHGGVNFILAQLYLGVYRRLPGAQRRRATGLENLVAGLVLRPVLAGRRSSGYSPVCRFFFWSL